MIQKEIDSEVVDENSAGESMEMVLDPQEEKKLLLKLDLALVPIIMLTYLSCFLDRSNIGTLLEVPGWESKLVEITGNVKVAHMPKDINASDSQFSTAISIF